MYILVHFRTSPEKYFVVRWFDVSMEIEGIIVQTVNPVEKKVKSCEVLLYSFTQTHCFTDCLKNRLFMSSFRNFHWSKWREAFIEISIWNSNEKRDVSRLYTGNKNDGERFFNRLYLHLWQRKCRDRLLELLDIYQRIWFNNSKYIAWDLHVGNGFIIKKTTLWDNKKRCDDFLRILFYISINCFEGNMKRLLKLTHTKRKGHRRFFDDKHCRHKVNRFSS